MIVDRRILDRLAETVSGELDGTGASLTKIEEIDPSTLTGANAILADLLRKLTSPNAACISIVVDGWGEAFERSTIQKWAGLDPSMPDEGVANAVQGVVITGILRDQTERSRSARSIGIGRPLEGVETYSTAHLSCDHHALCQYIVDAGSKEEARLALDRDMVKHMRMKAPDFDRAGLMADQIPRIGITNDVLTIPYSLNERGWITQGGLSGEGNTMVVWEDDLLTITTGGRYPETVLHSMVGRTIGEVVAGTPIGHRVIEEIPEGAASIYGSTHLRMRPERIGIDATLGPQTPIETLQGL